MSNQSIILSGDYLKGNLDLNNFNADNVSFIYEDDLKIDSENLKKNGNNLIFYNNFITSCKLDGYFNCPTWSFRIKETKYENFNQYKLVYKHEIFDDSKIDDLKSYAYKQFYFRLKKLPIITKSFLSLFSFR